MSGVVALSPLTMTAEQTAQLSPPLGLADTTRGAQPAAVAPTRAELYGRRRKPLGDPSPLACTVAKAALETVLGSANLDGLVRWLAPDVRDQLSQQHSLARRAGRTESPVVTIRRARVCRVSARAAEVSIVAYCEDRAHALAMRLEDHTGRWLVTVIDVG